MIPKFLTESVAQGAKELSGCLNTSVASCHLRPTPNWFTNCRPISKTSALLLFGYKQFWCIHCLIFGEAFMQKNKAISVTDEGIYIYCNWVLSV